MANSIQTRSLYTVAEILEWADAWIEYWSRQPRPDLGLHPQWLIDRAEISGDALTVGLMHGEGGLMGTAPFLVSKESLSIRFGYRCLWRWALMKAEYAGDVLCPSDCRDSDRQLVRASLDACRLVDAVRFESLPTDSVVYQLVRSRDPLLRGWWSCFLTMPEPRRLVRIQGGFKVYLEKFSSRRRQKLHHEIRKLEQHCAGNLRLSVITTVAELDAFVNAARLVSVASWQGTVLGQLIQPESVQRNLLLRLAERGWLRCYLLQSGDQPIAFVIGRQAQGVFYYDQVAHDAAWNVWSPGKVLLLKILDDLHGAGHFEWLDFRHGDAEYKRHYSTHCYDEAGLLLVRATLRNVFPFFLFRTSICFSNHFRNLLRRLGLIESVRRWRRRRRRDALHQDKTVAKPCETESCRMGYSAADQG
jgi:hypothetical protein